ncbi:MAG: phosphoadenosine phosphosulfate reductase family protein [Candidatus Heimdallarchaeota archaeon]|nr:phosphoadenosine phosphosulfate reductase family protein [Candidatus Heimdallarchaeota archaeon]
MVRRQTIPFLGAINFSWCDHCNLPMLDSVPCGICGQQARRVKIAPPGDIRPAFPRDLERISQVIDQKYGEGSAVALGLTGNRLVLLNEVSYDDLMDELIIDGQIVGSFRYDLAREDWDFYPRILGAQRIFENNPRPEKKYVMVDEGAISYIKKGYNVLAPGVIAIDSSLEVGAAVVALSPQNEVLSTGIMRIDASELPEMERGIVMKPKYPLKKAPPLFPLDHTFKDQTWAQAVKANASILRTYEQEAFNSIKKVMAKHPDLPVSLSFSGGKDSLVCLQLLRKLPLQAYQILFVDTGLEFPETIEYIEKLMDELHLEDRYCRLTVSTETFWSNVKKFGPPGKDFRFCCKILKIGPMHDLIEQCVGEKTLSIVGQRAYESIQRAKSYHVWSNPWIPNQLNFTPIQKWTALHVWLYIFQEQLYYNPLYEEGLARIGCWLCPASNQGVFEIIKEIHPDLWSDWETFLETWRKEHQLPKEWLTWGLWRWKELPKNIQKLATMKGVNLAYNRSPARSSGDWDLDFTITEGVSPCKFGGYSMEGAFSRGLNLPRIQSFWDIHTKTNYSSNLGILRAKTEDDISITLFANGTLSARGSAVEQIRPIVQTLVLEVFRAEECTGCQVCLSRCPTEAIRLNEDDQITIDSSSCTRCKRCYTNCPLIKFGHADLRKKFNRLGNFSQKN